MVAITPTAHPWIAQTFAQAGSATDVDATRSLWVFLVVLFGGIPLLLGAAQFIRPMHLALGFAATAALWAIGYVALLQPGLAAGEALFALMLTVLFVAGVVAGRHGDEGIRPWVVGAVSACANLLVVGAFLRGVGEASRLAPVLWVGSLVAGSVALAWLGGRLGRARPSRLRLPAAGQLFACVLASTIFLLIVLGGVLTGREAGLAVPDWPNSFGHNMLLYPITEMKGGVFYEHAHRLYGMLVGATAVVFVSVTWRESAQRWIRVVAVALLVMIMVQGLLGGLRVTGRPTLETDRALLVPSTILGVVHGVFAQVVFAASLVIAAATSRLWRSDTPPISTPASSLDRGAAMLLPLALVVQLVLGALYRHLQPGGGASAPGHPTWAIHAHMAMAVLVTGAAILAAGRAWAHRLHPVLGRLGCAIGVAVVVQLGLGVVAVAAVWTRTSADIPTFEVVVTTLHQGVGAILLGLATLLAAWSHRLLAADDVGVAEGPRRGLTQS